MKNVFKVCLIITSLMLTLAFTACNVSEMFKSDMEAAMDDILTGNNYTSVYKTRDDTYTTLKVSNGELYVSVKTEESTDEYYLWCDEENNEYYSAREWKRGEDKGVEKEKLDKDEYLQKYMSTFSACSPNEQIFTYRHVLEMAEPVSDGHYKHSRETYSENYFSKMEYFIEIEDGVLTLLQEYKDSDESYTVKSTYSDIGDTEISVPSKILNK